MKKFLGLITIALLVMGCAGTASKTSESNELDLAIRDASDYLNDNIPKGSMIAILNIQSSSAALSDYIIDELIANAVNDKIFKVVDRQQLDAIRAEQNFQYSGEVDDNLAVSIGKFLGTQTIVSGRFSQIDNRYRMIIRALDVQTAQVQGQYNRNIPAGSTITALMRSGGSSAGGTQSAAARTTVNSGATNKNNTTSSANVAPVDNPPEGSLVVNNAATWNSAVNKIRNGGNDQTYVIHVTGTASVPAPPNNENLFGSVTGITVTVQGGGTLSLSVNGCLLQIGSGQTVIVKNVTFQGRSNNDVPVVRIRSGGIFHMEGNARVMGNTSGGVNVSGGTFVMQGGTITSNSSSSGAGVDISGGSFFMQGGTISNNTARVSSGNAGAGGVYVRSGTFNMEGGAISGNTSTCAGGVFVLQGIFTMVDGTISNNTATSSFSGAGGVHVGGSRDSGTFIMRGGTISGNSAIDNGGGVYVRRGTFTKTGGTINGNDVQIGNRNRTQKQGHAVYLDSSPARWRNATAGSSDNSSDYGFWLND